MIPQINSVNSRDTLAAPKIWLAAMLASFFLAGCEQVENDFVYMEATENLLPAAQEKVKETLTDRFGSPSDPKVPHFFPINRGQISLTVADYDPETPNEIRIEPLEDDVDLTGKKVEFLFDPESTLDFKYEAIDTGEPNPIKELSNVTIQSYNEESGKLTLSKELPELDLIEPGLELAADPNHRLHMARDLYIAHCQHCHGVSGDGNGPTAKYMEPKPRDYRQGIFKFTSTGQQFHASTDDLKETLIQGIPGTYMPSFKLLPEEDLDMLVDYVKYLSMRGETELGLDIEVGLDFDKQVLNDELEGVTDPDEIEEIKAEFEEFMGEFLKLDYPEISLYAMLDVADAWAEADEEDAIVYSTVPRTDPHGPSAADPSRSSLENGRIIYLSKDAQCASCHGDAGRGDGFQTRELQKRRDGSNYDVPGLHDEWDNPLRPRNLTRDIYRGGRKPIDLFRRIHVGIKGTPMPAFGGKTLSDEQIWDVVNYVMHIPSKGANLAAE